MLVRVCPGFDLIDVGGVGSDKEGSGGGARVRGAKPEKERERKKGPGGYDVLDGCDRQISSNPGNLRGGEEGWVG